VVFFQWIRLSVLRFLPANLENPQPFLSTVLASFTGLALFTGGLGILLAVLWPEPDWRGLILLAVPILWAQAWFDLNQELFRSGLQPLRFGLASGAKAVSALALGTILAIWGLGAYGVLLGLVAGLLLAAVGWGRVNWRGVRPRVVRGILPEILAYGLPLTAAIALAFVIGASDRFLIAYFLKEGSAGAYAAPYDLAKQSLVLIMMVVNLAAFPLVVRALEKEGADAARRRLQQNLTMLIMVAFPATALFIVLAPELAKLLLGPAFRETGALLMPWIALAALLSGLRSYHTDLAFHLGRRTLRQVPVLLGAAAVNIGLNLWLIPTLGLMGAAYATVVAYLVAFVLSLLLGRQVFALPALDANFCKVVLVSLVSGLLLWVSGNLDVWLGFRLVLFITVLAGLFWLTDTAQLRQRVLHWLKEAHVFGY
jgi:O-antigen/teichoic acid export membrane protein